MTSFRPRVNILLGDLFSIGDKEIDLEFWGRKEKLDGICSVGSQELPIVGELG